MVIGQNGPGISNCVTAIAAAYWSHSPVVIVTPETGTMGIGLGGFQEANQLPMFEELTKYQGHVNNEHRMAELTGRCFDRALSEMGPTQLNIPRDRFYGDIDVEIPQPQRLARGPGGERTLNEAAELDGGEDWSEMARAMGADGVRVNELEEVGPALSKAIDAQINGGRTTVIEAMCPMELGDPFRKDALSRPIRHLDKYEDYV